MQARLTNFPVTDNTCVRLCYRTIKVSGLFVRVIQSSTQVLRPFIQFGMVTLAFWISLTRISDYFHHPFDVVTGAVVGIAFACVTLCVSADVFNKRSAFWKSLEKRLPSQAETQHHNQPLNFAGADIPLADGSPWSPVASELQEKMTSKNVAGLVGKRREI